MSKSNLVVVAGDDEVERLEMQGHRVEVRSMRSPDKRTPNEDAAVVVPVGKNNLVLAVADGVGGSSAGGEAARLVVGTIAAAVSQADPDGEGLRATILDAIDAANHELISSSKNGATTVVVAEIVDRVLRVYHAGDSELFVIGQRGAVKARLIPHSPTGFAIEAGLLDEDEAVWHNERHILFNVVGSSDMRVDISAPIRLARFDTVLLASDGLVDNLYVDEIVATIRAGDLSRSADELFALARKRMLAVDTKRPSKPDDLTIIACRAR